MNRLDRLQKRLNDLGINDIKLFVDRTNINKQSKKQVTDKLIVILNTYLDGRRTKIKLFKDY